MLVNCRITCSTMCSVACHVLSTGADPDTAQRQFNVQSADSDEPQYNQTAQTAEMLRYLAPDVIITTLPAYTEGCDSVHIQLTDGALIT